MKSTIPFIATAFVASAAVIAGSATDAAAQSPTSSTSSAVRAARDSARARLTALCGTWDVALTFWFKPGGPAVVSKGTSTIRPLFGGLFIEEKIEGTLNGASFTTLAWTGFNSSTQQYEATRIASTNDVRIAEAGVWDAAARRFDLKASYRMAGDTWTQRTIIEPTSADAMVATSYLSFANVPEWKAVDIRYTRAAR